MKRAASKCTFAISPPKNSAQVPAQSVADDPLSSVVLGAGKTLEDFGLLRRVEVA